MAFKSARRIGRRHRTWAAAILLVATLTAIAVVLAAPFPFGPGRERLGVATGAPAPALPDGKTSSALAASLAGTTAEIPAATAERVAAPTATARVASAAIFYATRSGDSVTVYRMALGGGGPEALFSFEERRRYPPADDPSASDAPSVALAPDGHRVAYSDSGSIRIRDLSTGRVSTVVSGTEQGEERPLRWSIPAMNANDDDDGVWGIWTVDAPAWSPDGTRLAFHQGWWEGTDFGIVDLSSGEYHRSAEGPDLEWIGTGDQVIVTGSFYTEPGRVHVSRPGDLSDYVDVTADGAGPPERSYVDAAVAPDGHRLAVAWQDREGDPRCCAAVLNVDGTGLSPLTLTGALQPVTFAPDGSAVYTTERRDERVVLVRHPTGTDERSHLIRALPPDLYAWEIRSTIDASLVLVGRTRSPYEGNGPGRCEQYCPPYRSRVLLLDPDSGETLYDSGDLDRFTAVGGFGDDTADESRWMTIRGRKGPDF